MSLVKVCDALCGSGKTSACINMINSSSYTGNKEEPRFLFVTEFLSEVDRIKESCKAKNFRSPEADSIDELSSSTGNTKLESLHSLLAGKNNIATTHSLFGLFVPETKDLIRAGNYILILDEAIGVVEETKLSKEETSLLCSINFKDLYDPDGVFKDFRRKMASKTLVDNKDDVLFFSLQQDTFDCFSEIYILTYMFESQPLCQFMKMWDINYDLIGVTNRNGGYEFCRIEEMDRRRDLTDKIHIVEDGKLCDIGEERNSLSYTWYSRRAQEADYVELQRNMINFFVNKCKAKSKEIMWTTYKQFHDKLARKGLMNNFVPFNKRASNEYANRRYLAYLVNIYWRPWEQRYYKSKGVRCDSSLSDMYALSSLVQWMFRSAIRNGEEIWIYIPSRRMRTILRRWIQNLKEGKDLMSVNFSLEIKKEKYRRERKEKNGIRCTPTQTQHRSLRVPVIKPINYYRRRKRLKN